MIETYQQRQARLRREAERRSSATYTRNNSNDTTDYGSSYDSNSSSPCDSLSDSGSCAND